MNEEQKGLDMFEHGIANSAGHDDIKKNFFFLSATNEIKKDIFLRISSAAGNGHLALRPALLEITAVQLTSASRSNFHAGTNPVLALAVLRPCLSFVCLHLASSSRSHIVSSSNFSKGY